MTSAPGFSEARAAIAQAFATAWGSRTPICWPDGGAGFVPPDGAPWVRFSILWGEGRRVALGMSLRRWTGIAAVQVFTPLGAGDGPSTALCDAAAEALADLRLAAGGAVSMGTPTMRYIGRDPAGGPWWQQNVMCPFRRDRTG